MVQEQLRELQAKAVLLEKRVATLEAARRVVPRGGRPENPSAPACVLFTEHITRDEEMDFVMKSFTASTRTRFGTSATRFSGPSWPWRS